LGFSAESNNMNEPKSKQITLNGVTIARRSCSVLEIEARFKRKWKNLWWCYNPSWNYIEGFNPSRSVVIKIHNV